MWSPRSAARWYDIKRDEQCRTIGCVGRGSWTVRWWSASPGVRGPVDTEGTHGQGDECFGAAESERDACE